MTRENLSQFPQSLLNREELTAERVYEAGRDGDELAVRVFKRFGTYLGIGLANLINIIDPEIIVIAGGAVNGWTLFAEYMHREVNERAVRVTAQQVKIAAAECGDNAGLLGAARLAFDGLKR
jgi:glucokinase